MNTVTALQKEIEQGPNLPVLPPGVSYLLKALSNDQLTYQEIAIELEKFPTITIKIIATANSAWATPVAPITTLRDACSRLGFQLVRSISIALSVSQIFNPARCPAFDAKKFWVSALLTADASYICAKDNSEEICADTARLAGLLHNMGLLWLAENKPAEITEATSISNLENISIANVLTEQYQLDMYEVGAMLANFMELPETIVSIISSCSLTESEKSVTTDDKQEEIVTQRLMLNHKYARQLAAYAILKEKDDSIEIPFDENNPQFEKLTRSLPRINSMAQTMFFS